MNNIILICTHRKLMNEIRKKKKLVPPTKYKYKKLKPPPPVFKTRRGKYIVSF